MRKQTSKPSVNADAYLCIMLAEDTISFINDLRHAPRQEVADVVARDATKARNALLELRQRLRELQ